MSQANFSSLDVMVSMLTNKITHSQQGCGSHESENAVEQLFVTQLSQAEEVLLN